MRNVRCKGNLDIDSAFALGPKKTVIESVGRRAFWLPIEFKPAVRLSSGIRTHLIGVCVPALDGTLQEMFTCRWTINHPVL